MGASCGGVIAIAPCSQVATVGDRIAVEGRFTGQGGSETVFVEVHASVSFDKSKLIYIDSYGAGSCFEAYPSPVIVCTWNGRVQGNLQESLFSIHFSVTQSGATQVLGLMQATAE